MVSMIRSIGVYEVLIGYILISLIVTYLGAKLFSFNYKGDRKRLYIAIFLFVSLLPILGHVVVLSLAIVYSFLGEKNYLNNISFFNSKEFLNNPYPKVKRVFGEGAISDIATNPDNQSQNKMKAALFMANHPSKTNYTMLKNLLSDQDNEVRLFSFSQLSSMERELNEKISKKLQEYNDSKDLDKKAEIASELSSLYWEFIYFGLSDEEINSIIIQKVEQYANIALKRDKDSANLYILLGKSAFFKESLDEAKEFFTKAVKLGGSKASIMPYLAEITFKEGNYDDVKKYLSLIDPSKLSSKIEPIYNQWTKAS